MTPRIQGCKSQPYRVRPRSASVVEALHEIASAGGGRAALLGAVRRATSGLLALRSAAGPPATTAALRKARRGRAELPSQAEPGFWASELIAFQRCMRARSVNVYLMRMRRMPLCACGEHDTEPQPMPAVYLT